MKETEGVSRRQFLAGGATALIGLILGKASEHVFLETKSEKEKNGPDASAGERDLLPFEVLSSYTEQTDIPVHAYARKNEDGRFQEGPGSCLALGDLFFAPVGSDLFVTFRNTKITPFLQCGESFMRLHVRKEFSRYGDSDKAWFYCKTMEICNWLGACYETAGGGAGTLTPEELLAADPHVYVRFPGCALQTKEAAKIRTLGVGRNYDRLFTVVHITDTHGDIDSTHAACEYADRIGADFIAFSGDYVPYYPEHGYSMLHSLIRKVKTPTVFALGNHDVITYSDRQVYEENIAPIKDIILASDGNPYYYRDFQFQGEVIRVICLYPFYEKARVRKKGYYTREQLLWLCDAMASAPDGAHVFIVRHFFHNKPILPDAGQSMFYDYDDSDSEEEFDSWINMSADPIPAIVDAYRMKEKLSAQYVGELEEEKTEIISFTYDFSDRPGSEFVAYFTGHVHVDAVGYARHTKTRQAVLSSICTTGVKGTEEFDYYTELSSPRDYGTDSQFALNVYTFDFQKKKIYVARVGNGNATGHEKTWMEMPY